MLLDDFFKHLTPCCPTPQKHAHSTYNPYPGIIPTAPSSRGYTGGFATALMLKDLNLALEAAAGVKATLPATSTAAALYSLSASPHTGSNAQLDFSAIIKLLK
jgi:3-hydroxyisobutyrate dehydrogenase